MAQQANNSVKIKFMHPRTAETYEAELDPAITGNEAIAALIEDRFIPAESATNAYALSIEGTNATLPRDASLASAAVKDGIAIRITATNGGNGGTV